MASRILSGLTAALVLALMAGADHPELTQATYQKWHDYILPKPQELGFRAIAWRPSFWDAVIEAQEKEKPVLLWTMNGHPLGCT
jgi:hypothetical protein